MTGGGVTEREGAGGERVDVHDGAPRRSLHPLKVSGRGVKSRVTEDVGPSAKVYRVRRVEGGRVVELEASVVVEEPLYVSVCSGRCSTRVIMRTPGRDLDLALGYVLTSGLVPDPSRIREVVLGEDTVRLEVEGERMEESTSYSYSSCGLCGSPEAALPRLQVLGVDEGFSTDLISSLPGKLREAQRVFTLTGGSHSVALFTAKGEMLDQAEDVGRHNAVDKVVGRLAREGRLPSPGTVMQVSGRVGYEIVLKSAWAGIPVVSGISAPTSSAVELGEALGVTIIGFSRGKSFNIYSFPERIL